MKRNRNVLLIYFTTTNTVYIYNQKASAAGDNHTRFADLAPPCVSNINTNNIKAQLLILDRATKFTVNKGIFRDGYHRLGQF